MAYDWNQYLLDMDEDEDVALMIESIIEEIRLLLEKMELEILLSGPFDDNNINGFSKKGVEDT